MTGYGMEKRTNLEVIVTSGDFELREYAISVQRALKAGFSVCFQSNIDAVATFPKQSLHGR